MKAKLSTMFVNITELAQSRAFKLSVCGLLILCTVCSTYFVKHAETTQTTSDTGRGLIRIGRRRALLALLARGHRISLNSLRIWRKTGWEPSNSAQLQFMLAVQCIRYLLNEFLRCEMNESQRPRVGVGVLVVRDNLILLGKRCGEHVPGYYAAPGGHLEFDESFVQCAKREVLEETGLIAQNVRFLMIGNYKFGSKHYVDVDMLAECPDGEATAMEPDKCAEWKWYHPSELPAPLFLVTERMIQAYLQNFRSDADSIEQILEQTNN